jgi:hypothetical protein
MTEPIFSGDRTVIGVDGSELSKEPLVQGVVAGRLR